MSSEKNKINNLVLEKRLRKGRIELKQNFQVEFIFEQLLNNYSITSLNDIENYFRHY